jgi:Icc-related predicted phosphoesterase
MILFIISCDQFNYHPYDGKINIEEFQANNYNLEKLGKNQFEDSMKFVVISDTHREDDDTKDFVRHLNLRKSNERIDFLIHAGDITNFGIKNDYKWTTEILSHLELPYITIIGNHDIRGHGDITYKKIFGEENFIFDIFNTRFICLNTNFLEYENSGNLSNAIFIEKTLSETKKNSKINRTIVVMHSPPNSEQFADFHSIKKFHELILQFPNLLFCLHGHNHSLSHTRLEEINYFGCPSIEKRTYLVFTLYKNNYTYEISYF